MMFFLGSRQVLDWLNSMEVTFNPRVDCVFATFAGPVSLEGLLQAFHRTYESATERGQGLILIDCSGLDGILSTHERFRLGESAVAYWLGKSSGTSWLTTSLEADAQNSDCRQSAACRWIRSTRGI